jgi:hypothetical protein
VKVLRVAEVVDPLVDALLVVQVVDVEALWLVQHWRVRIADMTQNVKQGMAK